MDARSKRSDLRSVERHEMVEKQLMHRGIRASRVLNAMTRVPREAFMSSEIADEAYADHAAGIHCGQTISQPYIVGLMTEALELEGHEKVLEVGTGSGYQTAILAELAAYVVSMERHGELTELAGQTLERLEYRNIKLLVSDGTLGCPNEAPFDRIIVTAAAAHVPPALFEQLAEGGIMVIPVGDYESQMLESIRKIKGRPQVKKLAACRFVPLISDQGQSGKDD